MVSALLITVFFSYLFVAMIVLAFPSDEPIPGQTVGALLWIFDLPAFLAKGWRQHMKWRR